MLTNNERKELQVILQERYTTNRNLHKIETIQECLDTNFFGYSSFKNLKKAHTNNYKKYTLSLFFESIVNGSDYHYYLSNIDTCIFTKGKYINFSYKELKFILEEFDFEINSIYFDANEEEEVGIYIELSNADDTEEILNLQQKRLNKINQLNDELERLQSLKNNL